jgi:hypothetical protein
MKLIGPFDTCRDLRHLSASGTNIAHTVQLIELACRSRPNERHVRRSCESEGGSGQACRNRGTKEVTTLWSAKHHATQSFCDDTLLIARQQADKASLGCGMIAHGGLYDAAAQLGQFDDHTAPVRVIR